MRLTLAVPDLLAQARATLDAAPSLGNALANSLGNSLSKIAHYAGTPVTRRGGLDAFLAAPSAPPERIATAPLAALGAGLDPGNRYVLRADPVSLVARSADVVLDARIADLDAGETDALVATLNTHFGADGLAFTAPRPDAWFIVVDNAPDLATTPLSAVRGTIYPYLPSGEDAATWRRWLSEMQMLLHDHPVNLARETLGRLPVTGIWISGGGRTTDIADAPSTAIYAAPSPAGDVARGLSLLRGKSVRVPPAGFAELPRQDSATVVLDPANDTNLPAFDRNWLGPAVAALERGSLASLTLLADGNGVAAAWHAQRPTLMQRVFARFTARPFALPMPEMDDKVDDGVDDA
jgi:hypothetical protein